MNPIFVKSVVVPVSGLILSAMMALNPLRQMPPVHKTPAVIPPATKQAVNLDTPKSQLQVSLPAQAKQVAEVPPVSKEEVKADNGWQKGTAFDYLYYEGKVYDTGSPNGINDGPVSKLYIKDTVTGKVICNYDRGWDIRPEITEQALVDHVLSILERKWRENGAPMLEDAPVVAEAPKLNLLERILNIFR